MKSIEEIILWQGEKRGMDILSKRIPNFCQQAAKAILECERGVIFLLTGFYVNGVAETDGPPGAYFMARSLKVLGFRPIIISDAYCKHYFENDKTIEAIIVDENAQIKINYYKELLEKFNPVALISIERCGRNSSNQYCNMRREDISEYTARLDELFLLRKGKSLTIGIGDGGNEIGMGGLRKVIICELNRNRKDEEKILPSIIPADYLVTATVSNWGAYGVIGYLQILSGKNILPSFDEIKNYLKFLVSKGAVDGVKKKVSISVDGYGINTIKTIIDKLHIVVAETTENNCTMNSCYDGVSLSQKHIGSRLADKLVKYVFRNHNKKYSILDVGCNTGELTNYINEKIDNKEVFITGSDINTESLKLASNRFPNLKFKKLDIYDIKSTAETYDIIFSNETLHWTPNVPMSLISNSNCVYYFFKQPLKNNYKKWGINCFEKYFINIKSLLNKEGVAFLQFGLDKQLFQVWKIINEEFVNFDEFKVDDLVFPIFYPELNQVLSILTKHNFKIIDRKEVVESLVEKSSREITDFIQGFCLNFISLKIGKTNSGKLLSNINRYITEEGVQKIRENQWHRLILIVERHGD